jgi:hypothetical protein
MKSKATTSYSLLVVLALIGLMLVCVVAFRYSYSRLSAIESVAGIITLLVVSVLLWLYRNRVGLHKGSKDNNQAIILGVILGFLWVIEISINNFMAPPLSARDIIDNIFWAIISLSILAFSILRAFQTNRFARGVEAGAWSGFVSGLMACCMALLVILFGMRFILQDPLNVAEWSMRAATADAPNMVAYFAFETFAGAFGHLIVLGVGLGAFLGALGGGIGKVLKRITDQRQKI